MFIKYISKATEELENQILGKVSAGTNNFSKEPAFMKVSKQTMALSTRGLCLTKLKSQKMSGGVFEIIKQIKTIKNMEAANEKEMMKLRRLQSELLPMDEEALIQEYAD